LLSGYGLSFLSNRKAHRSISGIGIFGYVDSKGILVRWKKRGVLFNGCGKEQTRKILKKRGRT
jgi:hypothetical protein